MEGEPSTESAALNCCLKTAKITLKLMNNGALEKDGNNV